MITRAMYKEDRELDIKTEGPAIFGQSLVNRLLKAKVQQRGEVKIKSYKTLGDVIDLLRKDELKNVRSLFRKQRREIVEYLEEIGVLEYLGIDKEEQKRLCEDGWITKGSTAKL